MSLFLKPRCIICIIDYNLLVMVMREFNSSNCEHKFDDETSNDLSQSGHFKNPIHPNQARRSPSAATPVTCPVPNAVLWVSAFYTHHGIG